MGMFDLHMQLEVGLVTEGGRAVAGSEFARLRPGLQMGLTRLAACEISNICMRATFFLASAFHNLRLSMQCELFE